ncbi:hypothetical protein PIB30_100252, partial [Stylosanthes scabra]|nr:hypothetical protein [Stylosanthes scabra]
LTIGLNPKNTLEKLMLKSCAVHHVWATPKRGSNVTQPHFHAQARRKRGLGMGYVWEEFLVMFLGQFHGCEAPRSKCDNQALPRPTSSHVWPKEIN